MIIIDVSSVAYGLLYQLNKNEFTTNLFRHVLLYKIGMMINDFDKSEEVILAWDNKTNWRKQKSPWYKANRKKNRDSKKDIDWDLFYSSMELLYNEFKSNLKFISLKVDYAEADDIIYVIRKLKKSEPCVIISTDKDLRQVCIKYDNTKLYDPKSNARKLSNKFIDTSEYNLFEHVLKGDSIDGVPNVLSETDTFITEGKRQTVLSKKKRLELLDHEHNLSNAPIMTDKIMCRINENRTLIDMSKIPDDISDTIIEQYNTYKKPLGGLFTYFMKNKLQKVIDSGYYNER